LGENDGKKESSPGKSNGSIVWEGQDNNKPQGLVETVYLERFQEFNVFRDSVVVVICNVTSFEVS
jgi:hypothetical protein